jgi:hypothetical protein
MLPILNKMDPAHSISTSFLNLLLLEIPILSLARIIFSGFESSEFQQMKKAEKLISPPRRNCHCVGQEAGFSTNPVLQLLHLGALAPFSPHFSVFL